MSFFYRENFLRNNVIDQLIKKIVMEAANAFNPIKSQDFNVHVAFDWLKKIQYQNQNLVVALNKIFLSCKIFNKTADVKI